MVRQIKSASTARAGQFPPMAAVLARFASAMTFRKVSETQADGVVSQSTVDAAFEGVFIPMKPQLINFKPEGQRAWRWFTLFVRNQVDIQIGDTIIAPDGIEYKVYQANQWTESGFSVYDIAQDFTTRPT